jgi:hypothetical protein
MAYWMDSLHSSRTKNTLTLTIISHTRPASFKDMIVYAGDNNRPKTEADEEFDWLFDWWTSYTDIDGRKEKSSYRSTYPQG